MNRICAFGVLVAASTILSACTPAVVDTPTPTPVVTLQCHGEFTDETHVCDQAEYDAMTARDAQYEEAEATYRRVVQLLYDLLGSRQGMSEEFRSLVTGPFAADVEKTLEAGQTSDITYLGQPEIKWVTRARVSDLGSTLALEVCTAPGSLVLTKGSQSAPAPSIREQVFFTKVDNRLRVVSNRAGVADTCDQ